MADLTLWFSTLAKSSPFGETVPALLLSSSSTECLVETIVDLSTSKASSAAPTLDGAFVTCLAVASGGSAWLKPGNVTVVAKAAGAIFLPENVPVPMVVRSGQPVSAINA